MGNIEHWKVLLLGERRTSFPLQGMRTETVLYRENVGNACFGFAQVGRARSEQFATGKVSLPKTSWAEDKGRSGEKFRRSTRGREVAKGVWGIPHMAKQQTAFHFRKWSNHGSGSNAEIFKIDGQRKGVASRLPSALMIRESFARKLRCASRAALDASMFTG